MKRWRGLVSLIGDAVEHGSRAIERVHKETARKPFALLEAIPPISAPAKVVHVIHDAIVTTTHVTIRTVNVAVKTTVDVALELAEAKGASAEREATDQAATDPAGSEEAPPP